MVINPAKTQQVSFFQTYKNLNYLNILEKCVVL